MIFINDNLKEYRSIRMIIIFPVLMLIIGIIATVLTVVNQQFSSNALVGLILFLGVPLLFIRYLINFSKTRYFSLELTDNWIVLKRFGKTYKYRYLDISHCVLYKMNDITDSTMYFKVTTKGFKRNIIVSNYKLKNKDSFVTFCDQFNGAGLRVEEVKGNLISQFLLLCNYTFGK